MDRRKFLRISSPLALAPLALNGFPIRTFQRTKILDSFNCAGIDERVLVLIQLAGGNDGLNTLIPLDQYDRYKVLRPTVALDQSKLVQLDSTLPSNQNIGLHPALTPLKSLYEKGMVRFVQGAGYLNHNRSHFKSTDLWLTGGDSSPANFNLRSGWFGRYLDYTYPEVNMGPTAYAPDPLGIQLGNSTPSLGFHTDDEHAISVNLSGQDPAGYYSLVSGLSGQPIMAFPSTDHGEELKYIAGVEETTSVYSKRITDIFNKGKNQATYPTGNNLGNQLKTVAKLISGGSKTRVFLVNVGGFDTHVAQVLSTATETGNHANLLSGLATAIQAFMDDLKAQTLDEKVMMVTFSEFGRKLGENANFGTDHGTFAPMMIIGKPVEGGVSGLNGNLSDLTTDLQYKTQQFDYRQVFTTVLQDWMGASSAALTATLFNGYQSQKLPLLSSAYKTAPECYIDQIRGNTTSAQDLQSYVSENLTLYPNPVYDQVTMVVQNPESQTLLVHVHDISGHQVLTTFINAPMGQSEHLLSVDGLIPGTYAIVLRDPKSNIISVGKMIKQ
jgi:uncharacterized protein (DUF1501 family)